MQTGNTSGNGFGEYERVILPSSHLITAIPNVAHTGAFFASLQKCRVLTFATVFALSRIFLSLKAEVCPDPTGHLQWTTPVVLSCWAFGSKRVRTLLVWQKGILVIVRTLLLFLFPTPDGRRNKGREEEDGPLLFPPLLLPAFCETEMENHSAFGSPSLLMLRQNSFQHPASSQARGRTWNPDFPTSMSRLDCGAEHRSASPPSQPQGLILTMERNFHIHQKVFFFSPSPLQTADALIQTCAS